MTLSHVLPQPAATRPTAARPAGGARMGLGGGRQGIGLGTDLAHAACVVRAWLPGGGARAHVKAPGAHLFLGVGGPCVGVFRRLGTGHGGPARVIACTHGMRAVYR